MQITVHINKFYDWEPLPKDAEEPSQADIDAMRVKPAGDGRWLMKVTKEADTYTTIGLPETQLVAAIIDEVCRGDRQYMTRMQAVSRYLSRHVMPHHAHKNWMQEIEVSDDGPDEALFREKLKIQVDAGNLTEEDVEPMVEAYLTPGDDDAHVDHLHKHFGIKNHAAFKQARLKRAEDAEATKAAAAAGKEKAQ